MLWEDPDVGRAVEPTWSVAELATAVAQVLHQGFPDEVWVRGEVHDLSRPASGHVYFSLVEVDEQGGRATLPVILSARNRRSVNRTLTAAGGSVRMVDGTEVRVRGRIDWFAPRGQLQLRMTAIDPAYTLGRLELARAELLARLDAEGLRVANRGRTLADVPLRVGVVTSVGSAAEADLLHELGRSGFGFRVTVVDARVQGPGAAGSIRAALALLAGQDLDVVALVRGGGARTDLAAFDTEVVARAIAGCPHPVVTGVGHEVDRTVADEVAHTAAKTPTACGALLVERVAAQAQLLEDRWAAVAGAGARALAGHDRRLKDQGRHLSASTRGTLGLAAARLDRHADRSHRAGSLALERAEAGVALRVGRLAGAARRTVRGAEAATGAVSHHLAQRAPRAAAGAERSLAGLSARVRALDPERALARGWSITRRADGSVVRSRHDVAPGERIATLLADGELRSTVDPPEEPDA
ncbi:MAG: exodeoxyribonuclease VII large subunit [Acidimicrobiia bacterium]